MLDERWVYRGDAVALAVSVTSPFQDSLTLSAGLPVIGGDSKFDEGGGRWQEIVSYDRVSASIETALPEPGKFETFTSATVEGLTVLKTLRVDRIEAQVMGRFHSEWMGVHGREHASIWPVKSELSGVSVNGAKVELQTDPQFLGLAARFSWSHDPDADSQVQLLEQGNPNRIIEIPNLGWLYYQQWATRKSDAEFTMLRLQLDGAVAGALLAVSLRVGGHWHAIGE